MNLEEYLEELKNVPKRLTGALLEKLLETDEAKAVKTLIEGGKRIKGNGSDF